MEAEVARWESAAAALDPIDWTSHRDWRALLSEAVDSDAIDSLEKQCRREPRSEAAQLLERFRAAERRFHQLLTERLRELGESVAYAPRDVKLERLSSHLPAVMARSYGSTRLGLLGWLFGQLGSWWLLPLTIIVTKKVLVVSRRVFPLEQISSVEVRRIPWNEHEVTVHRQHDLQASWRMSVSPSELVDALRARGIDVTQHGR